MDGTSPTEMPYGRLKWAALILAVTATLIALVFGDRDWLGAAIGYAMIIGLLCSTPMGRLLGPHARPAQFTGGLDIIGLAILMLRSTVPADPIQGSFVAFLGVPILVQGIFPTLCTWQPVKGRGRQETSPGIGDQPVD